MKNYYEYLKDVSSLVKNKSLEEINQAIKVREHDRDMTDDDWMYDKTLRILREWLEGYIEYHIMRDRIISLVDFMNGYRCDLFILSEQCFEGETKIYIRG